MEGWEEAESGRVVCERGGKEVQYGTVIPHRQNAVAQSVLMHIRILPTERTVS